MTNQPPYNPPPGGQNPPQPPYGNYPPQQGQPQPPYGNYPPQQGQPQPPYGNYPPQQGQPQMPYGSYPPPPPPKKKSKVGLIIGLVVGVFALFIVAIVIGIVILASSASGAKTDGEKVVTDFMSAIGKGDAKTAYSLLSPDFRQELSLETLQGQLNSASFIKGYSGMTFNSFSYDANNGVETLQLGGKADFGTFGSSNTEFVLRKVSGEGWKLTKYSIRPPS